MNADSSSGYHSNQEDNASQQQLSSLELENNLLKNEVASLNQEMNSVIHRAKTAQDGKETSSSSPLSHKKMAAILQKTF